MLQLDPFCDFRINVKTTPLSASSVLCLVSVRNRAKLHAFSGRDDDRQSIGHLPTKVQTFRFITSPTDLSYQPPPAWIKEDQPNG